LGRKEWGRGPSPAPAHFAQASLSESPWTPSVCDEKRPFNSGRCRSRISAVGHRPLFRRPHCRRPEFGALRSPPHAPPILARSPPRKRPCFAPAERPDASSLQMRSRGTARCAAAVAMRPSMALRPKTPSRPEKSVSLTLSHSLPCMAEEKHITGGSVSPRYHRANGLVTRTGPVGCIISPFFFLWPAVRVEVRIQTSLSGLLL